MLSALLGDLGPDSVDQVCAVFLVDGRERVDAMRAACAAGDADAAARSAHRLKSASGFLGASRLSALCGEVERLARDDRLGDVRARLDLVSGELEESARELRAAVRKD